MIRLGYMRIFLVIVSLLLAATKGIAQPGGQSTYSYLHMLPSARMAGSGGADITYKDGDPATGIFNPSLLNTEMHGRLSLNFINYLTDAKAGVSSYAFGTHGGTAAVSLQYNNYGKFTLTDNTSAVLGNFSAADYKLQAGFGKSLNEQISIGANYGLLYSAYESYRSFGMAIDAGAHFKTIDNSFQASLVMRNLGVQLKPFVNGSREKIPLRIQGGVSYKFAHVPLRLSMLVDNMQRWNLVYRDTTLAQERDLLTGNTIPEKSLFFPNLIRHFAFGAEFSIAKVCQLRLGYNLQRQQEMKGSLRSGMAGFSAGIGIRLSKMYFSYALGAYHFYGNTHFLTLGFSPASLFKKKVSGS
ncbi:MAG: type IX secretion system protein PorQ [Bacteroidota bacterium]|jgi:hypothetical protein